MCSGSGPPQPSWGTGACASGFHLLTRLLALCRPSVGSGRAAPAAEITYSSFPVSSIPFLFPFSCLSRIMCLFYFSHDLSVLSFTSYSFDLNHWYILISLCLSISLSIPPSIIISAVWPWGPRLSLTLFLEGRKGSFFQKRNRTFRKTPGKGSFCRPPLC